MNNPNDNLDLGEDLGEDLSQNTPKSQNTQQAAPKVDLEINTKKQTAISDKDKIKKWKLLTWIFVGVSALAIGGACAGPLIVNSMNKGKTSTKWNVSVFGTEGLEIADIKEIDKGKDLVLNVKTSNTQKPSLIWSYFILTGQEKKKLEDIGSKIEISSIETEHINWTITIPADKITSDISVSINGANVVNLNYEYESAEESLIGSPFLMAGELFNNKKFKNVSFSYDDSSTIGLPESEWQSLIVIDNETLNPLKESEPFELDTTTGVWQTKYSVKYKTKGTPYNFNKRIIDDKKEITTGGGGFTIDKTKNYIGIKLTTKEDITNFKTLVITLSNGTYTYTSELNNMYAYYQKDGQWKTIEIIGASDGINTKLVFNNQEDIDDCKEFYICYHNIPEAANDDTSISIDFEDISKINIQEGTYKKVRNTSKTVDVELNLNAVTHLEGLRYRNNTVKFYSDSECTKEIEIENLHYTNTTVNIPKNTITLSQIYFKPQLEALSQTVFWWENANDTASVYFNQLASTTTKNNTLQVEVPEIYGNMKTTKVSVVKNDGLNWQYLTKITLPDSVNEYINFSELAKLDTLILENSEYSATQSSSLTETLKSTSLKNVKIKKLDTATTQKWEALFSAEWTKTEEEQYIVFTKA